MTLYVKNCPGGRRLRAKMENRKMKKIHLFTTAIAGVLTALSPLSFAAMGNEGSGGGAGCPQSDGSVITLLECGAYQEPQSQVPTPPSPPTAIDGPSETPDGLNDLVNYINAFPYLEAKDKQTLLGAIQPSFYRKYFSVDSAPDLTQPIVDRIKGEFQRATGLQPSQLILYGVTDTQAKLTNSDHQAQITYLLPAFRNLKTKEEKMTALVHENYWVLHPSATYLDVVTAEMAFEAAMQKPDDIARVIQYVKSVIGNTTSPRIMQLVLKQDLASGALNGFANSQGQFTNMDLFGRDNIQCEWNAINLYRSESESHDEQTYFRADPDFQQAEDICKTKLLDYRDALLRKYPQSAFLASMKDAKDMAGMFCALAGEAVCPEFKDNLEFVSAPTKSILTQLFSWDGDAGYISLPSTNTITIQFSTDVNNDGPFAPISSGWFW